MDNQSPVNDFNQIKLEEGELFLILHDDKITGTLAFPADFAYPEKLFMDIDGEISECPSSIQLSFKATGRPNTAISDYLYEYNCSVTNMWEKGKDQRTCLTGTFVRLNNNNDTKNNIITKGLVASFIAVKRDFPEPKYIDRVKIIPEALSMLASKSHRLKHAVWHTLRRRGLWYRLNEESKTEIRELGWGLDRPPFDKNNQLDLNNGAGEDFLFMHRKMIKMVQEIYKSKDLPYIESWQVLPQPFEDKEFSEDKQVRIDTLQFFYSEKDDQQNLQKKVYRLDISMSGNMVPPSYVVPSDNKDSDLEFLNFIRFIKSPEYFFNTMFRYERLFTNTGFLSSISLGTLGNLLEFEIHNQMHMRWSSIPLDPLSGEPSDRKPFDFDKKWDDPQYDYLGDFYSSHVHPLFWKLHGWVDDRIEDWYNAHESIHPGEIERIEYRGVKWFKPGKWVKVSKPFYWPESHDQHHQHNNDNSDQQSIANMLKVMEIIQRPQQEMREMIVAKFSAKKVRNNIMSFMSDILPNNR